MKKALLHLRTADPVLRGIIEQVGPYRITYHEPDFTALTRSIVYQQLSGKAAATILGRVLTAAADRNGKLSPERLLALGPEGLRPLGLSQQKAGYVLDLARRTLSRELAFDRLPSLPDAEVIAALTAVKGVGVWTAHMFLIFALRRPDVLPTGDLGIRNAMQRAYGLEAPPRPAEMEELGRAYRPFASVASWYLWRSLDGDAAL